MALQAGNLTAHQAANMEEVRLHWPMVASGLMEVLDKCPGMIYWPEDFYHEIKIGTAKLLLCTVGGEYEGFMIVRIDPHPDGQCLHVWAMHHAGDDPDFCENAVQIFDQLARIVNAKRVTFIGRTGWLKLMEQHGYKLTTSTQYILERQ